MFPRHGKCLADEKVRRNFWNFLDYLTLWNKRISGSVSLVPRQQFTKLCPFLLCFLFLTSGIFCTESSRKTKMSKSTFSTFRCNSYFASQIKTTISLPALLPGKGLTDCTTQLICILDFYSSTYKYQRHSRAICQGKVVSL